ncbi:MAG: sulfate reduction electron transfer complex DsrMKJOP subunit DsrJ [Gemmatimonadota bacterium]|jgi:hypothetical protein
MGDKGKILLGLAIFVIFVTFPFWSRLAAAGEPEVGRSELEYPDSSVATACVEDSAWMAANHPRLLNEWRDDLVRFGDPDYVSSSGETFNKSLTKTCLNCHEDRDAFCTRCHDYADVYPTCWECHVTPGGGA